MKANLVVFTFIAFLALYTVRVALMTPIREMDNVNSQQLELHKSVLAKQQQETLVKFNTDNVIASTVVIEDFDAELNGKSFKVTIKNGAFQPENPTIEKGTFVEWINEDILPQTITIATSKGIIDAEFGENTLRPGDRFFFCFDETGKWEVYNPYQRSALHSYITVTD